MDKAALLLLFGGYAAVFLRTLPGKIWDWFFYLVSINIEFDAGAWSHAHKCSRDFINNQKFIVKPKNFLVNFNNADDGQPWSLCKGFGNYLFWFENRLVLACDTRKEITSGLSSGENKSYTERIIIHVFFPKEDTIDNIKQQIYKIHKAKQKDTIEISNYTEYWGSYSKKKRHINTVFLPDSIMDEIDKEVAEFFKSEEWYEKLGIPYHLGILLEGKPGNGKSSSIKAIASKYNRPIYKISLTGKDYDDNTLIKMFSAIPPRSIISIEDVDCLFNKREGVSTGITMSGLLNAIDGIDSPHGFILFMTTNNLDKLDPALIRAGRADRKFHISNAEDSQIENYFINFYSLDIAEHGIAKEFAQKAGGRIHSMADIQNHLRQHKNNPMEAISIWRG